MIQHVQGTVVHVMMLIFLLFLLFRMGLGCLVGLSFRSAWDGLVVSMVVGFSMVVV